MAIDLDDPIALMLAAAAALQRSGTECAAYGGLALGMYGEPRETIQGLIDEIPDHDVRGRFARL